MRGNRNGLKTRILELNKKALYVHCYGHALNLAVQDSVTAVQLIKLMLDTTHELIKLVKDSPKREEQLRTIKANLQCTSGGVRTLCPTRYVRTRIILVSELNSKMKLQYDLSICFIL